MRLKVIYMLIGLGAALMVASCRGRGKDSSAYVDIPAAGWAYTDTLLFNPMYPDSLSSYQAVVSIDYSPRYRYRNLWLEITSPGVSSSTKSLRRDTVEIIMSDSTGSWVGTGIAGNYQLTIPPVEIASTASPLVIRHIMRTDTLRDINRVGVFFSPIDN